MAEVENGERSATAQLLAAVPLFNELSEAELEHRAVPEHRLRALPAENEPRGPLAGPVLRKHLPTPFHAQVAPQDEPVLEAQQEVLAHGLHAQ